MGRVAGNVVGVEQVVGVEGEVPGPEGKERRWEEWIVVNIEVGQIGAYSHWDFVRLNKAAWKRKGKERKSG